MLYKVKVAICSEIRTKHINAMWAPCIIIVHVHSTIIVECQIWWYVKKPLSFKRLNNRWSYTSALPYAFMA
jgi:hypothetical protein